MRYILVFLLHVGFTVNLFAQTLKLSEIRVRDPFILAYAPTQTYYLYAQMGNRLGPSGNGKGVEVYTSQDLENWTGPTVVFEAPDDFWGRQMTWAPEVHEYKGRFYLFVTFTGFDTLKTKGKSTATQWKRGTQILRADRPEGPFELISEDSQTPPHWMSLDGSLWVEDGIPYMVFCHEWAQVENGTIDYVRLSNDLSKAMGKPKTILKATDVSWVASLNERGTGFPHHGYVTDGNFIYKTKEGKLVMIWSTFGPEGYALIQAVSDTGKLKGPWKQIQEPLFAKDGGHGMIFKTFQGQLMLTFHQPNRGKLERARLYKIRDKGDRITLVK